MQKRFKAAVTAFNEAGIAVENTWMLWDSESKEKTLFHDIIVAAVQSVAREFYPDWKRCNPVLLALYDGSNQGADYYISAMFEIKPEEFAEVKIRLDQVKKVVESISFNTPYKRVESFFLYNGKWIVN